MRLVDPTDFEVLEELKSGRNVAANIAIHIDQNRPYINNRLPHLADHGLVKRIGPAPKSGVYELADRGRAALSYRGEYSELGPEQFGDLVNDVPSGSD